MNTDISNFLANTDWQTANIDWFGGDWSVRDYARLTHTDGRTSILLKSPPDDSPHARVGNLIGEWARINKHFDSLGLNVPEIFKMDLGQGLILMQDFGDKTIVEQGLDAYITATDILVTMRDHPNALKIPLKKYEDTHVYQALKYYPQYVLNKNPDEWFTLWGAIENKLPPCPRALTHIDYAAMNLMWNNGTIGIIDFQAACDGPFVYDMVNLLEDIRHDVPENFKKECIKIYCAALSPETCSIFSAWYPIITAQFYAKILGQIQFLKQTQGRKDLMQYYAPITERFIEKLGHPLLKPLKDYIEKS